MRLDVYKCWFGCYSCAAALMLLPPVLLLLPPLLLLLLLPLLPPAAPAHVQANVAATAKFSSPYVYRSCSSCLLLLMMLLNWLLLLQMFLYLETLQLPQPVASLCSWCCQPTNSWCDCCLARFHRGFHIVSIPTQSTQAQLLCRASDRNVSSVPNYEYIIQG